MGYRLINHLDVGRTLKESVNAAHGLRILLVFYQHPVWFISFYYSNFIHCTNSDFPIG